MNLAAGIERIKNDRQHGAFQLACQALELLRQLAQQNCSGSTAEFLAYMVQAARELSLCRPSMASISNAMNIYINHLLQQVASVDNLPVLQQTAVHLCDDCINEMEQARLKVIEQGANLISANMIILTCSYSSAIAACLLRAWREGKYYSLLAAESCFQNIAYGELIAQQLAPDNIPCQVFPDTSIPDIITKADMVLLGADAVLSDGSLVNGYPSLAAAKAGFEINIPVYVLGETLKFSSNNTLVPEEGFDVIPGMYLTGIITEKGLVKPDDAQLFLEQAGK